MNGALAAEAGRIVVHLSLPAWVAYVMLLWALIGSGVALWGAYWGWRASRERRRVLGERHAPIRGRDRSGLWR